MSILSPDKHRYSKDILVQHLTLSFPLMEGQKAAKFPRPCSPDEEIRINYQETRPKSNTKGTILLIHGFPLTSYEFVHVLPKLVDAGWHVIAPDYTGAGGSSKPDGDYTKHAMAADLRGLVRSHLNITHKIHIVAHDIGCMIGHAYSSCWPGEVATITLGECPLPGTAEFEADAADVGHFHVNLHAHVDLAVALISGKEEVYMRYFFDKQAYNTAAFTDEIVNVFVNSYQQPGAIRATCLTYKAFSQDKRDNLRILERDGKCSVPALALGGSRSHHAGRASPMVKQLYESVEEQHLPDTGHYLALESPQAFADTIVGFITSHSASQSPT